MMHNITYLNAIRTGQTKIVARIIVGTIAPFKQYTTSPIVLNIFLIISILHQSEHVYVIISADQLIHFIMKRYITQPIMFIRLIN